ncbi:MAG: hypothetical protein ACPGUU_01740 [Flavobacteriaceae bacterium]
MRWHKFISVLLHPVVLPTIGVLLYFVLIPISLERVQQYAVLSIVFVATYLIPVLLLFFLKSLKLIHNFQVHSIKERKIPLALMIFIFYALATVFSRLHQIRDLSILFYGTAFSLFFVYLLFIIKLKSSLHLLSMGSAVGFILVLTVLYSITTLPIIAIMVLLSGLLASSRLHLKAHTTKEIYVGFFIGIFGQFAAYYFL